MGIPEIGVCSWSLQVKSVPELAKLMKEVGLTPPTSNSKSFAVMGKEFNPAKPDDYLKSFAIKRV